MNLIRIFLVAWMFEHPSMAPRLVEGRSETSDHQNKSLVLSSEVKGRYSSKLDEAVGKSNGYSPLIDDCFLLCSQKTSLKYEFDKNKYSNDNKGVFLLNSSKTKLLQNTRANIIRDEYVQCKCGAPINSARDARLTKKVPRSADLPLKLLTSPNVQTENAFSETEMKNRVEKDLALLLSDVSAADERNERLYTSDNHYSDILLSISNPFSYSDDLLPEQFENDVVVETENTSNPNEALTLFTEDLKYFEKKYFEKNLSVISVLMEDEELLKVPPSFISSGSKGVTVPVSTVNTESVNDKSLLMTTTQKAETSVQVELHQPNSSRSRKSGMVVNSSDVYTVFRSRYPVEQWKSLGYFTEDYLGLINKHWLQFHPPYHRSHYILAALYTVIMTVGVTGNCLVIFMFIRCRSLRTPANVLVMNLALSDFFLLVKMPVFIFNCFYFGPALGAIGCEVYGFLGGLTGTVSIMTLAAIAVDRYYVIVYPLDPLRRTTRQRARLCVALVWCYGCAFASMPLTSYGFSRYVPEGYLTSCSFDYLNQSVSNRVFILVFFFAAWFVPFSVIAFCYIRIYRVVISGSSGASSRRGQEEEKRKTEIRLAGVIVGVIGLWFISWTPYAIVALLGISGNAHLISPLSSMIPALFCKAASCIDPYVYAVTHPRFRREFQRFFCNRQTRRRFETGKTQCWKTESSQIPGMMIGIRHQRVDYSLSEEDVEEMVVMVDNRPQKTAYFAASTIAPEEHNLCEVTFPPDSRTNEILQHPSWFMPPQSRRDRSTSLKLTGKGSSRNTCSDPTSV